MIQNGGPTLKLVLTVGLYPHRATLGLFYSRSLEGLCTIGALDMSPSTRSFYLMIDHDTTIQHISKNTKTFSPGKDSFSLLDLHNLNTKM